MKGLFTNGLHIDRVESIGDEYRSCLISYIKFEVISKPHGTSYDPHVDR